MVDFVIDLNCLQENFMPVLFTVIRVIIFILLFQLRIFFNWHDAKDFNFRRNFSCRAKCDNQVYEECAHASSHSTINENAHPQKVRELIKIWEKWGSTRVFYVIHVQHAWSFEVTMNRKIQRNPQIWECRRRLVWLNAYWPFVFALRWACRRSWL